MFDGLTESFNDRWNIHQTVDLYRAARRNSFVYGLDEWPEDALQEALKFMPDHARIDRLIEAHCDADPFAEGVG